MCVVSGKGISYEGCAIMQIVMVPEPNPSGTTSKRAGSNIAGILRERIRSGYYQDGEWLPTERDLTEDLRVHRRVVRGALAQLEQEGFILRRPHCRPVVQTPAGQDRPAQEQPIDTQFPSSKLVALVMWHGGSLEEGGTAQQRIFWGMNQALGNAGYHAVFLDLGDQVRSEQENAEREEAHLKYVLNHKFGGAVFYSYAYGRNRDLIREVSRRLPFVLVDRTLAGIEADFVGVENHAAMFDATLHLIANGHRRIAYVTTAEPINPVQDRLQGYVRAMRETFGQNAYEMVLTLPAHENPTWRLYETVFALPEDQRPTALLCVNDYIAVGAANRLSNMGLKVPQDVSLIGFDNLVHTLPSGIGLTTVAQRFEQIGKSAAELIVRRLEKPNSPTAHIELAAELIVRDSTASL